MRTVLFVVIAAMAAGAAASAHHSYSATYDVGRACEFVSGRYDALVVGSDEIWKIEPGSPTWPSLSSTWTSSPITR